MEGRCLSSSFMRKCLHACHVAGQIIKLAHFSSRTSVPRAALDQNTRVFVPLPAEVGHGILMAREGGLTEAGMGYNALSSVVRTGDDFGEEEHRVGAPDAHRFPQRNTRRSTHVS